MNHRHFDFRRASSLLAPLAYDDENKLFLLDDQALGFGFLCEPLAGGDERVGERIQTLLRGEWPKDTLLQFSLVSSQNIGNQLLLMRELRSGQRDPLMNQAVEERAEFLRNGVNKPIIRDAGVRVRDLVLIVTCMTPINNGIPTEKEIERTVTLLRRLKQGLETTGFYAETMTAESYLGAMDTLINAGAGAGWRNGVSPVFDTGALLRDQVFGFDTSINVKANEVTVGDRHVRTLSVKQFPKFVWFGHAAGYIGDPKRGQRGIRSDFIIHATVHFPDPLAAKNALNTKRTWAVNQAYGPMLKFAPTLATKKHSFDVLFEALEDKDVPVRLYLGLTLIAPSKEEADRAASNAISYWAELGLMVMEDRYFVLPFFLHSLPFGADRAAMSDMFRYKTMASRHVIPMLPIFGDWKGTGTPALQFVSRNGQLMNVSLFDSTSNFNCVIAAESGAGKSFLTNEIITSYLSMGGRCWVIDVGRSYEKLCQVYGGDFLHFGRGSTVCLNPFEIIEEWDEEADLIANLVTAMAAPTESLSDLQMAHLKRVLKATWDAMGKAMTVDHVAEALMREDDQRIRDVGEQLHPFTSAGEYGAYFNGPNTMKFSNNFMVLELEELKGRRHLQQVVLLLLIYQIQQDMYLGARDKHKVVIIDEAWDLLSEGDVAKFIETGYRRFRKYGGSAITITQSVTDLYDKPSGRAIAENSANMYLLQQKSEAIEIAKKDNRLPLSQGGYDLLKTVHTVRGAYSEILFITKMGAGIGRLVVDPFHQLLYSTKAEEVEEINRRVAAGMSTAEAINSMLEERHAA